MASPADTLAAKSYDITIVRVAGLPRLRLSWSTKAYVQIEATNLSWSTRGVRWENGGEALWAESNTWRALSASDTITFSLMRDHKIKPKTSKGSLVIKLADLLEECNGVPSKAIERSLQNEGKETCKLTLLIAVSSATTVPSAPIPSFAIPDSSPTASSSPLAAPSSPPAASSSPLSAPSSSPAAPSSPLVDPSLPQPATSTANITPSAATFSSAVNPLERISTQLSESGHAAAVEASMGAAGETIAGLAQSDLVGSLTALVDKLSVVVKIGDEIAKLVKAQHDRDNKIRGLIVTMHSTYATVDGSEVVKDERLQDVLDRILKQTIECGLFIQQYARGRSFAGSSHDNDVENSADSLMIGKVFAEAFSNTDGLVAQFQGTFEQLKEEFHGRIATKTALMTADIASTVKNIDMTAKAIRLDQLKEKLGRVEMEQSERDECLPGTRMNSINMIMDWYSDESDNRKSTMWLHGLAGAGKSTLSTTIARMMGCATGLNLLGAFFFFDRNIAQRKASTVIRTIAYQLAEFDPTIGANIQQVVSNTPGIADMPLDIQFSKLLSREALGDIHWTRGPILIIIDALDEASSGKERERLLKVLSEGVSKLPSFMRLLVVSRRERDIMDYLNRSNVQQEELKIDPNAGRADLTAFIRSRLDDTRERNILYPGESWEGWPSESEVDALVDLASGHFIWAHTACRIIGDDYKPKAKLKDLIRHQPTDSSDDSFDNLYQLYKSALGFAIQWSNRESCAHARTVLGAIVAAQVPLSSRAICDLLGQDLPSLQVTSRLGSVLDWTSTGPIRIVHASFYDYLTLHSMGEAWGLNVDECNSNLAYGCIALLAGQLKENMCDLVLPRAITNETLPEATSYAANFWIEHVCLIVKPAKDLADTIHQFMRDHLLHWMEALSIGKTFDVALRSLPMLLKWIQENFPGSDLFDFVKDAHRFARYFEHTIIEHPLFIYISALPFTPCNTIIYKTFFHERLPHVVAGVEPEWPPLLQVLRGHESVVYCVSFSPDGSTIVSGSADKTVRVWDSLSGQPALPPLQGHEDIVRSVCFSPDGSRIVSGSDDNTIRMWDALSGQPALPPLQGHEGPVMSVCFSPDGSRIVSGSLDGTVRVWDALSGQPVLPPLQGHDFSVWCVCFSPDGSRIVSGSFDMRVWDALSGQPALPPLRGHENAIRSVCFSPDGSRIVSASYDHTVQVWDALSGEPALSPLLGHKSPVLSACFSPDGSRIVSGSWDKTLRVWDAPSGQPTLPPLRGHICEVSSVCVSPDGSRIVSGSEDMTVRVWDALSKQLALPPLQGHEDMVSSACFSRDGSRIVSKSYNGVVRVWDVLSGQPALPPIQGQEGGLVDVSFSPDGSKIISKPYNAPALVWDARTGHPQEGLGNDIEPRYGVPSYTAQILVSLGGGTDNYFRNVVTGQYLAKIPRGFSPNFDDIWGTHKELELLTCSLSLYVGAVSSSMLTVAFRTVADAPPAKVGPSGFQPEPPEGEGEDALYRSGAIWVR
ncbi:hypothetical protein HWV62_31105 [Athelia sp. TMB]|nr:hypothetical protein HWV62_31105 [Athelia sp. TMB]